MREDFFGSGIVFISTVGEVLIISGASNYRVSMHFRVVRASAKNFGGIAGA